MGSLILDWAGVGDGRRAGEAVAVGRLRSQRLGDQEEFSMPATADALAVLQLAVALQDATCDHYDERDLGGVSRSTLWLPDSPD